MSPPRVSSHSPEPASSPSKKLSSPLQINGINQLNGHVAIEPYKMNGFVPEDSNNRLNELLNSVVERTDSPTLLLSRKIEENQENGDVHEEDENKANLKEEKAKDKSIAKLESLLHTANQQLRLRNEEVDRLSRIRNEVEAELEELTASLFQEAHNMVREANVAQAQAEKALKESQMKVEVLQAEVAALKTLVITSTPSRPNPHLHPQLQQSDSSPSSSSSGMNLFNRKHRRSPSHFNLKYGRENSPPDSPVKEQREGSPAHTGYVQLQQDDAVLKDEIEFDPVVHKEFLQWKEAPTLDRTDPFISRVYREDIDLCLNFCNGELGAKVYSAVEAGTVYIEAVTEKSKSTFPKKCALLEAQRICSYRLRLGEEEQWHTISQLCRNRITAVCDFLNYLRYIERGLVKSSAHDVFCELVRLRKEIILARLGMPISKD
ncbi:guanine nucleotide exchange factor for Rab-3A-like isoform X2 [Neocloeon triangulifer]|uniref:guanine nucleotide exchange factor for Rab-3A-like isoform X2 n=1 Tax=Neocloeon triangulifer TaxID=2078957 RepID=UPI00286EEA2E|nr:guanine nucleotide exchange factor for Rab-3A-like isoform X2 [Neocloeon triangulifer]